MLNDSEIQAIKKIKFKDVLLLATGLKTMDLQENVFQWMKGRIHSIFK